MILGCDSQNPEVLGAIRNTPDGTFRTTSGTAMSEASSSCGIANYAARKPARVFKPALKAMRKTAERDERRREGEEKEKS